VSIDNDGRGDIVGSEEVRLAPRASHKRLRLKC
jgi:hypothetical protein